MEITFIYLLWGTSIVFTLCSFLLRRQAGAVFFPLISAIFWTATAMSLVQIDFVGFGATNVITYNHELGDWYGDVQLIKLLNGVAMIMFVYTIYNVFMLARGDMEDTMALRGGVLDEEVRR